MLHIVYRSFGGENRKGRPAFYSKFLALKSFIRAVEAFDDGPLEVVFLNDGPVPEAWLELMHAHGEVLNREPLGLFPSLRAALALPAQRGWPDDHLVWFAEDDYLYLPDSLRSLPEAARQFPEADYFTFYAQFGHRRPNGSTHNVEHIPSDWQDGPVRKVHGHAWRKALSTTCTFGGRVRVVNEDNRLMRVGMKAGGAFDHVTWMMLQGYSPYSIPTLIGKVRNEADPAVKLRLSLYGMVRLGFNGYQALRRLAGAPPRILVAPDPALNCHLETAELAAGVDWAEAAEQVEAWVPARAGLRETVS